MSFIPVPLSPGGHARRWLASPVALATALRAAAVESGATAALLPTPLDRYADQPDAGLWNVLVHRASFDPFNVVAGAVAGGGLTVIANVPNPAAQAILARHFPEGVAPLNLLLAVLAPTMIMAVCFMAF